VLIYAACSASFFAWLTGSPFILHDMGYSPAAIGLSYVPQTIAFLVGGYGCRAALQKWEGQQMLPWLLVLYALSVIGTWAVGFIPGAGLAEILIPFCVMALRTARFTRSSWRRRYVRSRRRQAAPPRCRIPCSWVCASWQVWWSRR
jgi:hypothetical protein